MGKGVDFFPFNRRRIASNTKDFILFFVNKVRKDSLQMEAYKEDSRIQFPIYFTIAIIININI